MSTKVLKVSKLGYTMQLFTQDLRDTQGSMSWIYDAIKQIMLNDEGIKQ
jgi:hypothetical protein